MCFLVVGYDMRYVVLVILTSRCFILLHRSYPGFIEAIFQESQMNGLRMNQTDDGFRSPLRGAHLGEPASNTGSLLKFARFATYIF
jgi:hypothetical protein